MKINNQILKRLQDNINNAKLYEIALEKGYVTHLYDTYGIKSKHNNNLILKRLKEVVSV